LNAPRIRFFPATDSVAGKISSPVAPNAGILEIS
jgi:hypothetical protein